MIRYRITTKSAEQQGGLYILYSDINYIKVRILNKEIEE